MSALSKLQAFCPSRRNLVLFVVELVQDQYLHLVSLAASRTLLGVAAGAAATSMTLYGYLVANADPSPASTGSYL